MILVPILSLILYGSFIAYSYLEHQRSNEKVEEIRDDYFPALNLVNENIHLFEQLRDAFKDAVLASESIWIADALKIKVRIEQNLDTLEKYPSIISNIKLREIRKDFKLYYISANEFAEKLIQEEGKWIVDESLIQDIDHYLNITNQNFFNTRQDVQHHFKEKISETNELMNHLLFWGSIISVISMIFIIIVTLVVSISTRRNLRLIVDRTKELTLGTTDFSRRIKHSKKDEIGRFVFWINKLSDKLEEDYVKLKKISITDKLTQLNNRNRTDQFLPKALSKSFLQNTPLILVIIDIDHFKRVNDNFGHLVGDLVLQHFAEILKKDATQNDYISRW